MDPEKRRTSDAIKSGKCPKAAIRASDVQPTPASIQANVLSCDPYRRHHAEPTAAPIARPKIIEHSMKVNAYVVGPAMRARTRVHATSSNRAAKPDKNIAIRTSRGPEASDASSPLACNRGTRGLTLCPHAVSAMPMLQTAAA